MKKLFQCAILQRQASSELSYFGCGPFFENFCIMVSLYQGIVRRVHITGVPKNSKLIRPALYSFAGCLFIIAMSGLRYGVGADYISYERIYNTLHSVSFGEYWVRHTQNIGAFYVEPAYYILNRILPSYRLLLWGMAFLTSLMFFCGKGL